MLQRWSKISWKGSMFWKACNQHNTWECWTCTGCNQQWSVIDSERTRSWSGDSQNFVSEILMQALVMKSVMAKLFHGFCNQSRRNIVLQLPMTWLRLIPCDFWLFPKLKSPLKGKRFHTINKIQEKMTGQLMAILMKDFAEGFEQWKRWCENCDVPRCLLWRELRCHCPMYNISCILYLLQ